MRRGRSGGSMFKYAGATVDKGSIGSPGKVLVGTPITQATTITESGPYYIANDFSATGQAITIAAANVTINGNWKTVTFNTGNSASVDGIASSGTQNNITIQNLNLKHGATTATECNGIAVRGDNWVIEYCAITDNGSDYFYGIAESARESGFHIMDNLTVRFTYVECYGEGGATQNASIGIYLHDRAPNACQIHNNILADMHRGIYAIFWGLSTTPVSISNIYRNQIQVNRVENAKSQYAVNLGRSSKFHIYQNRLTADNGRGVTMDGFGGIAPPGPWSDFNEVDNNAIGCNFRTATKTAPGGSPDSSVYGVRIRYDSNNNNVHDNNVFVTNQLADICHAVYVGSNEDETPMVNIDLVNNVFIANEGNVSATYSSFIWEGNIGEVTITGNQWQSVGGSKETFFWPFTDDRQSVTDDGSTAYSPGSSTPAAVTGLSLRKFFDSYVLSWNESTETDVWAYKIYKDDVANSQLVYSARAPHASVPSPFWVDINETGTVEYKVAAVTLTGTEGTKSSGLSTTASASGWQ